MNAHAIDRATKAKAVLDSPAYQDAYAVVREAFMVRLEALPMAERDEAEDIRRCLMLLKKVQRAMETAINTGKLEQFRLTETEERKKNPLRGIFNRGS